ncbi:hypothetical protein K2X33_05035 [bacterium]|nr:hypothetical protein [bacterium]
MKKRILLIDESLTVQKVVALTLDRERYTLSNAKNRPEAMKQVLESPPDLILVSDQVAGLTASSFPREVESWVGRDRKVPALVLITASDAKEQRGYVALLKKPFTPQALQICVNDALGGEEARETRLEKVFTETFSDEARLVEETYAAGIEMQDEEEEATLLNIPAPGRQGPPVEEDVATLWGSGKMAATETVQVLGPEDSMAYKAQLEKEVRSHLDAHDLEGVVREVLEKIVPPMVERLAQQRLDQLLKESESFVELKP